MNTLDIHAPKKGNTIRGNTAPFMNKTLSKSFMHRAKRKSKYNKNPTRENHLLYKNKGTLAQIFSKKLRKNIITALYGY